MSAQKRRLLEAIRIVESNAIRLHESDIETNATLFERIEEQDRRAILGCGRAFSFFRDSVLFLQGQPVHSLALIRNGSVKLTQTSHDGNEVLMWVSGPGDVLGLLAGSSSSLHTCSATVLETGSGWL
jgi:CRP-like cAMP-binding protein